MHFKLSCIQSDSVARVSTVIQPCIIPFHRLSILCVPHCICMWPQPTSVWVQSGKTPREKIILGHRSSVSEKRQTLLGPTILKSRLSESKMFPFNWASDRWLCASKRLYQLQGEIIFAQYTVHLSMTRGFILSSLVWQRKYATFVTLSFEIQTENKSITSVLSWKQSILRLFQRILVESGSASNYF